MASITVYASGLTVEVFDKVVEPPPPQPPPPQESAFFSDVFSSGDLSHVENGCRWTDQANTRVITSPNGTSALEFTFPTGTSDGDAWAEQRFSLGGNYPELWMSYDLYIPQNYVHRNGGGNNKAFSYFWSGDYGALTGPLLATNFWPDGNGGSRLSQWMRTPTFGGRHLWADDPVWIDSHGIISSDLGQWMHVVVHAKYATEANNDGVYEIWKNGAKLIGITNGDWYVPNAQGFDQGYLLGWANSGFDVETKLYIDNIKFSAQPLP